ncbi:MAG: serine hydrolase domain-containing protein [Pseudomonadota bacterium]
MNGWRNVDFAGGLGSLLILGLLTACTAPATSPDDAFSRYSAAQSPGAAVMVIRDGEVVHAKGYGLANLETQAALDPATPVRLGSVSKAFTAMAIVLLAEAEQLTFDTPAVQWVPELKRFPTVTLRHLLNHTSGLPSYYEDESGLETLATALSRQAILQNAEAAALYLTWGEPRFAPGERFEYSNPGYEILALVVERITGKTFGEYLQAEIFTPLGMKTAAVRSLPDTVIARRAVGYAPDGSGWVEADDHWGNWLVGAGGVYASLQDLYLWDQALDQWAAGDRLREAFAPAVLNDGSESLYGFGWELSPYVGQPAVSHTGSWVGFRTSFVRYPEAQLSIVVLSNASLDLDESVDAISRYYLKGSP